MNRSILIIIFIFQLIACFAPRQNLERGNNQKAFKSALAEIEKTHNVEENTKVLNEAFKRMLEEYSALLDELLDSDNILDAEETFAIRDEFLLMTNEAKPHLEPALQKLLDEWNQANDTLAKEIGDTYVMWGIDDLKNVNEKKDRELAWDAYDNFNYAKIYYKGPKNLDSLISVAEKAGTVILLVEAEAPFDFNYNFEIDQKFEKIVLDDTRVLKVYYEPVNIPERLDCIIRLSFRALSIDDETEESQRVFTKQIESGTITIINDEGEEVEVPEYKEVTGTVFIQTTQRKAKWGLVVHVEPISYDCQILSTTFYEEKLYERNEYTTRGDLEAIPGKYQEISPVSNTWEEDEIARELIELLYEKVKNYLF
jgi:hypothetical protein